MPRPRRNCSIRFLNNSADALARIWTRGPGAAAERGRQSAGGRLAAGPVCRYAQGGRGAGAAEPAAGQPPCLAAVAAHGRRPARTRRFSAGGATTAGAVHWPGNPPRSAQARRTFKPRVSVQMPDDEQGQRNRKQGSGQQAGGQQAGGQQAGGQQAGDPKPNRKQQGGQQQARQQQARQQQARKQQGRQQQDGQQKSVQQGSRQQDGKQRKPGRQQDAKRQNDGRQNGGQQNAGQRQRQRHAQAGGTWQLHFLLQARDDPSLIVPAKRGVADRQCDAADAGPHLYQPAGEAAGRARLCGAVCLSRCAAACRPKRRRWRCSPPKKPMPFCARPPGSGRERLWRPGAAVVEQAGCTPRRPAAHERRQGCNARSGGRRTYEPGQAGRLPLGSGAGRGFDQSRRV